MFDALKKIPALMTKAQVVAEGEPLRVPGLRVVGNGLDFLGNPVDFFVDSATRFGPAFRADIMGKPLYVLVGSHCAHLMGEDQEGGCPLTRKGQFGEFATETEVDLFGLDGAEHRALRKRLSLGFSRIIGGQFTDAMVSRTRQTVRQLPAGHSVRMLGLSGELAMRNMMLAMTPVDLEDLVEPSVIAGDTVMNVVIGVWPKSALKLPRYRKARAKMVAGVDAAIERHQAGVFASDERMWMADAFLAAADSEDEPLTPRQVRGALLYSLAGTYVYLARAVSFIVYHLLRDPALLAQARLEVDTAVAQGPVTPRVLGKLTTLRTSFRECMRMYPPVPGLPFKLTRDVEFSGLRIPSGAHVAISSIPDHYNPEYYARPYDFRPERWLPENRQRRAKGSYGPFGLNSRTCAASGLVELVVLSTAAGLVHELDARLPTAGYRPRLMLNPLLGPGDGLPIEVMSPRVDEERHIRADALTAVDLDDWHDREPVNFSCLELVPEDIAAGVAIVNEGEEPDAFYLILEGNAEVLKRKGQEDERVATLTGGESFGEVGLLNSVPRTATVRALTDLRVLRLDRDGFQALVTENDLLGPELGAKLYRRFIDVTLRQTLPSLATQLGADAVAGFSLRTAEPGEIVVQQGQTATKFYVLAAGSAEVILEDQLGQTTCVGRMEPGDGFGEIGLLESRPRSATVRVDGDERAVLLVMERAQFLEATESSSKAMTDLGVLMRERLLSSLDALAGQ